MDCRQAQGSLRQPSRLTKKEPERCRSARAQNSARKRTIQSAALASQHKGPQTPLLNISIGETASKKRLSLD